MTVIKNTGKHLEVAAFAGGCFWCTEAVFQRLLGVVQVDVGFSGGSVKNPAYREVITGRTGHAETVRVTYNPEEIRYQDLLEIFFATHDPTTINQQGADLGTHYRSVVFYSSDAQRIEVEKYLSLLEQQKQFTDPIVTELQVLNEFYPAEEDHKNYFDLNPDQGYCRMVIHPKIQKLESRFKEVLKPHL